MEVLTHKLANPVANTLEAHSHEQVKP